MMWSSDRLAGYFEPFRGHIRELADKIAARGARNVTPADIELLAGDLLISVVMDVAASNDNWRHAQLLNYLMAYYRREAEEKEDRGFPFLPIFDWLDDYRAAEYYDIVPYSKYTIDEARTLPLPALIDPLVAVLTVSADRRSQIDNGSATFYRWETARDSRVCGTCKVHEGEIIGRSELIRESNLWELGCSVGDINSTDFPPLHPRCRCVLVPIHI